MPARPSEIIRPRGRHHLHQVARFLVAGGLSFAADVGTLVLLHEYFGWPIAWATTGAYLTAFVINFGLNATWVFGSHDRLPTRLVRYVVLVLVNYVVTLAVVVLLTTAGLWYVGAKLVAVIICLCLNFFAYRNWVYA